MEWRSLRGHLGAWGLLDEPHWALDEATLFRKAACATSVVHGVCNAGDAVEKCVTTSRAAMGRTEIESFRGSKPLLSMPVRLPRIAPKLISAGERRGSG